jgi:hypothetical protein
MNEDLLSITPEDLNTFAQENQLSSSEEKEFKLNYYNEGKKAIDIAFKDDPDKRVAAYQQFESSVNSSLNDTRKKAVYEYALAANEDDREAANEDIMTALNWNKNYESKKSNEPKFITNDLGLSVPNDYGIDKSNEEVSTIFNLLRSKDFQLNEKTSKPAYINDAKGNPIAQITTKVEGDNRTAFYKFFNNKDGEVKVLDTQEVKYSLPSDSEVASYIEDLNQKVKDGYPAGGYGTTPYAQSIAKAFDKNPSKEAQNVRDAMKEAQHINSLSPEAAKEYIATKKRNESILSSDYVRQNVTDINAFEDFSKGLMTFEYTAANFLTDGGYNAELNAINTDNTYGSETTGLKDSGFDKFLKEGVVPGMQSLGNMAIPLIPGIAASAITGGAGAFASIIEGGGNVATLSAMGASSYGAQLNQNDNNISRIEDSITEKVKIDPLDPEINLLKKDLDNAQTNRRINALGHAIAEVFPEFVGAKVGGAFLRMAGNGWAAGAATEFLTEQGEEALTEPLNHLVDLATLGERLTPKMQDPVSIFYATSVATAPLIALGIGGHVLSKNAEQDQPVRPPLFPANKPATENDFAGSKVMPGSEPTLAQAKTAAVEADAISETLAKFEESKDKDESTVNQVLEGIKGAEAAPVTKEAPSTYWNGTEDVEYDSSSHVAIPDSTVSTAPVSKEGSKTESKIQSTEKPEITVEREQLEHAHSIFESSTDFNDFSNKMKGRFGEGIVNSLKSIWDWILNSFKSAYNVISDSIVYATQNTQGNPLTFQEAGDARRFANATNYKTATFDKLEEVRKKYPALYNVALQSLLAQVDAHGTTNIHPADLAKLYSFKEKGFSSGVSIVDEGMNTAKLEGNTEADGAFVNPDGTPNGEAPVFTDDEQKILRTLYHTNVINEDQLDKASRGIFKRRKFLSLYARAKGKNVTQLNNSADSTTNKQKQQSKVKEAYSTNSVINPNNESAHSSDFIEGSYVHGTNDSNDVLKHLGITPKKAAKGSDPNYFYLTKKDLKKLYDFYDSKFGKDNWVVKDSSGAQGEGFHTAESLKDDLKSDDYNGINYEGIAQKKLNINSEYRINVYLDSKGKARAVPFTTSKKESYGDGTTGHEFPYRVTSGVVKYMQRYAETALERSAASRKDKSTGKGAIYGIDVAVLNNEDGTDPFSDGAKFDMRVIELNSADPYHDSNNIGGVTGTFSMHGGYTMANLQAFLRGRAPADIALTNVMLHLLKTGGAKVDGQSLVPAVVERKNEAIKKEESRASKSSNVSEGSHSIDMAKMADMNPVQTTGDAKNSLVKNKGKFLKNIIAEARRLGDNSHADLLSHILKVVNSKNKKIYNSLKFYIAKEGLDSGYVAEYSISNHITLSLNNSISDVIHELVHAFTVNYVEDSVSIANRFSRGEYLNGLTGEKYINALKVARDSELTDKNLKNIINSFLKAKEEIKEQGHYGLTNIDEFIAEALSNKEFQDILESIKVEKSGLWTKLKDAIFKFFSLGKENSILREVLFSTSKIISTNQDYLSNGLGGLGFEYGLRKFTAEKLSLNYNDVTPEQSNQFRQEYSQIRSYGSQAKTNKPTIMSEEEHKSARLADIKRISEANPITQAYRYRIDERFLSPSSVKLLKDIKANRLQAESATTGIENIKAEERTNKFAKMKRMNPNAFPDFVLDPYSESSMDLATQTLLDYLDSVGSDPTSAQAPRKMTAARKEAEIQLNENIGLFQGGYINHPEFTELPINLKEIIIAGVHEISKMNDGTSTNNLKRAAASLGSLLDNGNPVGFMKYANEFFSNTWISRAQRLDFLTSGNVNEQIRSLVGDPLSNYRRGHINNNIGSFVQLGVEIDKFSKGDNNIFAFMSDLFSSFAGNLDPQQAERDLERGNFTNFVNANYPKRLFHTAINDETNAMPAESRALAGIASVLIQYKVGAQDPLVDLKKHFNLMNLGINYRSEIKDQMDLATIDRASFNYLTAGLDYDTMTHNQIISTILGRLSPQERNVLDYLTTRSRSFLPAMRVVSSISGNRQLEEWENYNHQKILSDMPDNTISGLAAFNSMEPPLQIREGLGTETGSNGASRAKGYYETDILTLGDDFFHMATYEKHTGVQRQMLKQLLDNANFTDMLENAGEESVKPKVKRIKELLGNIHAVRTNSTFKQLGAISSAALELIGIGKGFRILSTGAIVGNMATAITSQLSILSLEGDAKSIIMHISSERLFNRGVARGLRQVMENNFPSQMHRLVSYDEAKAAHITKNKSLKRLEDSVAAGSSLLNAVFSHGLGAAYTIPVKGLKLIGKTLSYAFSAFAEGQSATNMWWSIYIDKVNQLQGTSFVSGSDFLSNPVINNDAATYATLQTDKITGNTSLREHQGSTYHLNNLTKIGVTNTIMPFLRQQIQLSQQAINEIQHAGRASTNKERARHLYRATVMLANNLAYAAVKYVIGWFILDGIASSDFIKAWIKGSDDEETKKLARLEIERQHKIRQKRRDFNIAYDLLATTVANPFFNSSVAKSIAEYGNDILRTKPEDAERAIAIKGMENDIRHERAKLSLNRAVNDFEGQSDSIDRIRSLEESIDEKRNLQGLKVSSKDKYAAMTANLGALSIITDQAYPLLEAFETQSETEAAIAARLDQLNKTPSWGKLLDTVLKTGATNFTKGVATDLAQKQLNDEKKKETEIKKASDKISRRLGL